MAGAVTFVVVGLVMLTVAADRFVVAAARLSRIWGLSPVLIGALVLGMGTSAPELLVGILAAAQDRLDLAIGSVVGSNVANVTLVLGVITLAAPLAGHVRTLRREGLLMLASVLLLATLARRGGLLRPSGLLLLAAMGGAALLLVRWARRDTVAAPLVLAELEKLTAGRFSGRRESIIAVVTLLTTLAGAQLLVTGAGDVAQRLDISEGFIGLTLVAVGTSLPELATGIAAARRREQDLVVGNVLGSNLFNSLTVAGASALAGPGALEGDFGPAMAWMVVVSAVAGVLAFTSNKLVRWEGAVLVVAYAAFIASSA